MESAFYYWNLTDVIPDRFYLATKRVNIVVSDSYNNRMTTKLDIGVHKNFDITQDEYCFD